VAMDDQPLKDSAKILVQVGTAERPADWKTKPAEVAGRRGEEVLSFGHAPWMIARSKLTVSVKNASISRARVLDANGMPNQDLPLQPTAGGKTFQFPPEALYVVLQSTQMR